MPLKIVITDCSWRNIDIEKMYLPQDAVIESHQCTNEDEVIAICKDADAILSEYAPFNKKVLKQLNQCKIISNSTTGVDNIDIGAATELGIAISNVPGYCSNEVADHTMALILASNRNIIKFQHAVKNNHWDTNGIPPMRRIAGQVLGLVGFGNIAQNVAIRARCFGMKVITHSSVPKELLQIFGVERVELETLLENSDIISVHVPLNSKTEGYFDSNKFKRMKKRPLFVNTARGKIVNENDLIEALEKEYISGAVLDVLQDEPPKMSNKLLKMDNVIITPHAAFISVEALLELRRRSAMNITNFFNKEYDAVHFLNNIARP